jgi:hypothetical protein
MNLFCLIYFYMLNLRIIVTVTSFFLLCSGDWRLVRDQFLITINSVALDIFGLPAASLLSLTAVEIQQI